MKDNEAEKKEKGAITTEAGSTNEARSDCGEGGRQPTTRVKTTTMGSVDDSGLALLWWLIEKNG